MEGLATRLTEGFGAFCVSLQVKRFISKDSEEKLVAVEPVAAEQRLDAYCTEGRKELAGVFDEFGQRASHDRYYPSSSRRQISSVSTDWFIE